MTSVNWTNLLGNQKCVEFFFSMKTIFVLHDFVYLVYLVNYEKY